jgi:ATP/maltotriose-dependent transcriptional regulator MalT
MSMREREVLRLIAAGHKNREIADELVVVTGTVKAHINMIYQKLGVTNRIQAITRARSAFSKYDTFHSRKVIPTLTLR